MVASDGSATRPGVLDDGQERVRERVASLDSRLAEVEALADAQAREVALAAIENLVEVYGLGLARLMARLPQPTAHAVAEDELVAHLLLVHGLHPVDLETRVRRALDQVRPSPAAHAGDVELLAIQDGVRQGNRSGAFDDEPGHINLGESGAGRPTGTATARRSTSINRDQRNPIDPRSPNLPRA